MDNEEILRALRAIVESIAPGSDLRQVRPDRPLREQIELDSMDWLNLVAGVHERLHVDIPESDQARLDTLDAMVAYLAARLAQAGAGASRATTRAGEALPHAHRLPDGTALTVRPIRAIDAPLEADFVRRLSDESRYQRFMGVLRELPASKLKYLTDVDQVRHVALVATVDRDGLEVVVGAARYIVDPAGTGCEFAIAVDDHWQGSGAAGILMHALIDAARARGLQRMEGIVLAANHRMLKFVRQLGFTVHPDPGDRCTVRVVRELQPAAGQPDS